MAPARVHHVTFEDLTLEYRALDGKPVYRWFADEIDGLAQDDFVFVNVPAQLTRGIPIAVFAGGGTNALTKSPGTGEVRFYNQANGEQGARKIGDVTDVGQGRIDLGAGDRGVGGGATDYVLHKGDYAAHGPANMMSFDIREDRLIGLGDAGWEVTAVDFASIDRSHATERTGVIKTITVAFHSNEIMGSATARLWLNSDRDREPEDLSLDWTGGAGAWERKIAAAQEFAEAGLDQWLFI